MGKCISVMPGSFCTHTRPGPAPGLPRACPLPSLTSAALELLPSVGLGEFPAIGGGKLAEVGHPMRRGAG